MNPPLEDHLVAADPAIRDTFSRPLNDLRISVIDQCNFRCTYCMPAEGENRQYSFLQEHHWLHYDEIVRLARLLAGLGVTKLRLTGGEPLLRPGLTGLVAALAAIDGIDDLALTTNGLLLSSFAEDLKRAGLNRITVSLDAIEPAAFRKMSGQRGRPDKVLEGIRLCEDLGFSSIKINTVVQKGVNDAQVIDLVRQFKGRAPIVRFIEYMDVGNCNHWNYDEVVPSAELARLINAHFPIEPVDPNYFGEVANRYRFKDGSGEIGFISSITQPFCRSCTRARLSADGTFYTCLFAHEGLDLRTLLRQQATDQDLVQALKNVWQRRTDRYSELRTPDAPMTSPRPKVEMFRIGG